MARDAWLPLFLAGLWLSACVSHVPLEGSACPCPDGLVCCEASDECRPRETSCPSTYPPSSGVACLKDIDCPHGERCESWTVNGVAAGPGQCRHACTVGLPCAEGEICSPSLHDLEPLRDLNVARLCIPALPPAGCEDHGCRECDLDQLANTYCDGNAIRGCFVATHPVCGLTCVSLVADDCGLRRCVAQEGKGARCEDWAFGLSPCVSMACSLCGRDPGTFFCNDNDLSACVSLGTANLYCGAEPCGCREICSRRIVRSCERCVEANGTATCSYE